LAPAGLDRVFLADSGSVGVEVAMKMALQHQRGTGHPERTRFLTVRGGYHGDTFDCMSVCDPEGGMHAMWSGLLPQQVFGERPPRPGGDVEAWAAGFRALAAEHADQLAGLSVEPLLQGAGGMHPYPAEFLSVF
ncbi:aminotransferase class III-fold pyridoxal phosphate-dependent enzyme, partial [Klebsiella pneumoniae]|nr:aminotransferase class III-fold pyridoxal phosphate-dependent enzyme [Klebsiella pneumoniae]